MIEDTAAYKEMMRMNYDDFCAILQTLEQFITPKEIYYSQRKQDLRSSALILVSFVQFGPFTNDLQPHWNHSLPFGTLWESFGTI